MKENEETQLKASYLVLIFFFAAIFLRLSMDGFNLPYPGNLKSVDAFLHAINTEWVVESGQIKLAPPHLSNGYRDVVFFHPPLLYVIPALMSIWTGLDGYNTVWFLAAFISALPILLLYLIGEKIFNSKKVGILGSLLFLLPATNLFFPEVFQLYWMFPSYIGLWNTVIGKTVFIIQLWLVWEMWNKPRDWVSILLGMFFFMVPTGLAFATFLPKLIGVWLKTKPILPHQAAPQLFENFYFLKILWEPVLILYSIGFLLLLLGKGENYFWFGVNAYVLLWLGLLPLFFSNEEYFEKLRFLVPFAVFPVAAFGGVMLIEFILKRIPQTRFKGEYSSIIYAFLALLFVSSGLAQYNAMKQRMSFEEMTQEKYNAMLWIQENTPEDSRILLFDGFNIASGVYSKRVSYQRNWDEYSKSIEAFDDKKNISTIFHGRWLEEMHNLPFERNFFSYAHYPLPSSKVDFGTFDYVVMWDFSEKAENYNLAMKNLLGLMGFKAKYDRESITIMMRVQNGYQ
jgi:hypothetical protein